MKYRTLDDVAYEIARDESGQPVFRTAVAGEVIEINDKDAATLRQRGAIEPVTEE